MTDRFDPHTEIARLNGLLAEINAGWQTDRMALAYAIDPARKWRRLEQLAAARGIRPDELDPDTLARFLPTYTRLDGDTAVYLIHEEDKTR
jgi:hypothetical protein